MPSKSLSKYAKARNTSQFNIIQFNNLNVCPKCITTNVQQRRENLINANLLKMVQSAINTYTLSWPTQRKKVNPRSATNLLSFLPSTIRSDSIFEICTSVKQVAIIKVGTILPEEDSKECQEKIIGGRLPTSFEIDKVGYNNLNCPSNADYGIIRFGDSNDFVVVGEIESNEEDIMEYGRGESQIIRKNVTASRSGEAGGLVYPDTDSSSLCEATKKKCTFTEKEKFGMQCIL